MALFTFAMPSNWDVELARLKVLTLDGPEALAALDPAYPEWQPASDRPGEAAGKAADLLADDAALLAAALGLGGPPTTGPSPRRAPAPGARCWPTTPTCPPCFPVLVPAPRDHPGVVAGRRLSPRRPAMPAAHNGHLAWGVTAGLIDNTDFFLEEVGPDGRSVRRADRFVPCEIRTEVIEVRGGAPETIEVLVTDRGPLVGPAFLGEVGNLSMSATWLVPRSLGALFDLPRARRPETCGGHLPAGTRCPSTWPTRTPGAASAIS